MKIIIHTFLILVIILLNSCSSGDYTYIESGEIITSGRKGSKDMPSVKIDAKDDQTAYIIAYERFQKSKFENGRTRNRNGYYKPLHFELRNKDNVNIALDIVFVGKKEKENKIKQKFQEIK